MTMQEFLFFSLAMGSAGCLGLIAFPVLTRFWATLATHIDQLHQVKADTTRKVLDELFFDVESRWLKIAYSVVPLGMVDAVPVAPPM